MRYAIPAKKVEDPTTPDGCFGMFHKRREYQNKEIRSRSMNEEVVETAAGQWAIRRSEYRRELPVLKVRKRIGCGKQACEQNVRHNVITGFWRIESHA